MNRFLKTNTPWLSLLGLAVIIVILAFIFRPKSPDYQISASETIKLMNDQSVQVEVKDIAGKQLIIEIKSVNSKQLDLSLRNTSLLREKEQDIKTLITKGVERGKVDVSIFFDNPKNGHKPIKRINTKLLISIELNIIKNRLFLRIQFELTININ